ncbi:MAG: DUF1553 domain-containing protein [Planctomycetes bacterium]|nr:DUF1553 domain-containing protein [Planctomycetota bacterium]
MLPKRTMKPRKTGASRIWAPLLGMGLLAAGLIGSTSDLDYGSGIVRADGEESPKVAIPSPAAVPGFPVKNAVDRFILQRLQDEKLEPSGACSDDEFIRRVYLDLVGVIPSRVAVRAFLKDPAPAKRERLVAELLKDERYGDHWAIMWGDLLREHSRPDNNEGILPGDLRDWIRTSLKENWPYDKFVTELLTAEGRPDQNGAVSFFLRDNNDRVETVNMVSIAFMGTRMQCAQCHDHPFDRWTQEDFHGMMAFMAPRTVTFVDENATLTRMKNEDRRIPAEIKAKIDPFLAQAEAALKASDAAAEGEAGGDMMMMGGAPKKAEAPKRGRAVPLMRQMEKAVEEALGKEQAERLRQIVRRHTIKRVVERPTGEYHMPNEGDGQDKRKAGGELVKPAFPWEPDSAVPSSLSRRAALAKFVTSNRQFAQVQVNRLWAQLMGRGLVHPVDDFRQKNPPTHPELLEWLTDEFIRSRFDNQHIIKLIVNSSTYQRSTRPTEKNKDDKELFSHFELRRMTAEQIHDSLLVATGQREPLQRVGKPRSTAGNDNGRKNNEPVWAVEVQTPARGGSFLEIFGQPDREQVTVERENDGSITQALEMLNGGAINQKVAATGNHMTKQLIDLKLPADKLIEELFLAALSRLPSPDEAKGLGKIVRGNPPPAELVEDLYWALLNSREFVFVK